MSLIRHAVWDVLTNSWLCPDCLEPLDSDGLWREEAGTLELYACNDCAVEYCRDAGTDQPLRESGAWISFAALDEGGV